ncbi:hypothetical protein TVAG_167570 [Trichomonas vaginalis G3]|uniref:GDA1/CD39 family protein n=1 Tax=Trichomonas vaginalis (strain ATCC PRA-98 / G3) TaxID=412133 RepID=A2GA01_TRIV3|nr:8-oxo-dGTP phosphohydrolase protein [Trichomonas vaginalis G3]EAX86016.1 hypothetical protein TVAG_167570 [Trichomonas vaginalis G3]KAI5520666.1 8-oxo-dGTP phosphohydrolase protein [Trichomonas vaginalis G3]|eukprot:XP_001298946.1 hypothetical protein [Trichomonas vaginalis G3]
MVDAGSSGTRGFLYTWNDIDLIPEVSQCFDGEKRMKYKAKIRLASAAEDPEAIQNIFKPMIDMFMKKLTPEIAKETPIYVYATAGMRLLSVDNQEKVFSQVYDYFKKNSLFLVKRNNFRVISGVEEGVYGWLSVNNLLENFKYQKPYVGSIDLGGASFQIALQVNESEQLDESILVKVGQQRIRIFSHSYLGYGVDVSSKSISKAISAITDSNTINNPCFPRNYTTIIKGKEDITVHGTGDFDKCARLTKKILIDGPHFETVNIPGISGQSKFVGMANLYFVNNFFGLPESSSMEELKKAGTSFCSKQWSKIEEELKGKESLEYAPTYCYCAAYQYTLLQKGFNFKDGNNEIRKLDDINGVDLSWAIGAMLAHVSDIDIVAKTVVPMKLVISVNIAVFCVLALIYIVISMCYKSNPYTTMPPVEELPPIEENEV